MFIFKLVKLFVVYKNYVPKCTYDKTMFYVYVFYLLKFYKYKKCKYLCILRG